MSANIQMETQTPLDRFFAECETPSQPQSLPWLMGFTLIHHLCQEYAEILPSGVNPARIYTRESSADAIRKLTSFLLAGDSWEPLGLALEWLNMEQLTFETEYEQSLLDIASELADHQWGGLPGMSAMIIQSAFGHVSDGRATGTSRLYGLASEILHPTPSSAIYDPRCSSGEMLFEAYEWTSNSASWPMSNICHGQDEDAVHLAMAIASEFIRTGSLGNYAHLDVVASPAFNENGSIKQFDYVVCDLSDPAANEHIDAGLIQSDRYGRFALGAQPTTRAGAILQHIAASLSDKGRAVIIVNQTALQPSHSEAPIVRAIVEADLLESVVSLPQTIVNNGFEQVALITFNRLKATRGRRKVEFIYADDQAVRRDIPNAVSLTLSSYNRIVETLFGFRKFGLGSLAGLAAAVSVNDIARAKFNLLPSAYVLQPAPDDAPTPSVEWRMLGEIAKIRRGADPKGIATGPHALPLLEGQLLSNRRLHRAVFEHTLFRAKLRTAAASADAATGVIAEPGDILIQKYLDFGSFDPDLDLIRRKVNI